MVRTTGLAGFVDRGERGRRAAALLRRRGCKTIIFYLWRPYFDRVLDSRSYDLSCYHIVDEYSFSPSELPLTNQEIQLIKRVDQVFVHFPALLERKRTLQPPYGLFVPNGVNYRAFATQQEEPADLKEIPHPKIGYIGVIKTQLDFKVLLGLATRHVEWSFVFVGPKGHLGTDTTLVEQLVKLPNVYFLGHKPIKTACAYPQHFDVCLLPYKANDYTKYIYPLKLHEYLAGGKPIVGTPIRSLLDFAHVIKLASTQEEWSERWLSLLHQTLCRSMRSKSVGASQSRWIGRHWFIPSPVRCVTDLVLHTETNSSQLTLKRNRTVQSFRC